MYATPVGQLKQLLTSRDLTELLAAERMGLIPDPWRQTGTLCAVMANHGSRSSERPANWQDFVPMVSQAGRRDMNALYARRKSAHGKGP